MGEAGRFAAFLEAPPAVTSLRLRTRIAATGASWAGTLLWAGELFEVELQLSGEEVKKGAILAEKLTDDVRIVNSIFFVNTEILKKYDIATELN